MSSIGSLLGGGGKNSFKAEKAKLDETKYGPGIENALSATQAQMAANAGGSTDQTALVQALQARASGQTPSLAQEQLRSATDANIAQSAGSLASVRGINPALAARMIAQNQAGAQQAAAGQAATTRLQEQVSAEQQLAQALDTRRQQDIAQQQANTTTTGTLGQLQQGQNQGRIQNVQQANETNAASAAQNAKTGGNMLGGLLGAVGGIAGTMIMPGVGTALGSSLGSSLGGAMGKYDGGEIDFRAGGRVPGVAPVSGDDPRNDVVDAKVSPGEIVLPRTVAQAENAPDEAAKFVAAIQARKKGSGTSGYGRVLQAQRALTQFLAEGGEVETGVLRKFGKWLAGGDEDDAEEDKRDLERAVDETSGLVRRAKDSAKAHNKALEDALALSGGRG